MADTVTAPGEGRSSHGPKRPAAIESYIRSLRDILDASFELQRGKFARIC
ncbi:MAG: hypothetical protein OXI38_13035 [Bacteroidota bacterium]|nr:hypothetical protein [Bacteroidota bacterium]